MHFAYALIATFLLSTVSLTVAPMDPRPALLPAAQGIFFEKNHDQCTHETAASEFRSGGFA